MTTLELFFDLVFVFTITQLTSALSRHLHLLLLLGIVAIAAGEKHALAEPGHALTFADALALGAGTALYLAGDVGFRRALGLGSSAVRGARAAAALATIPLGTVLSAWVQLAALVALFAGALVVEARGPYAPRP